MGFWYFILICDLAIPCTMIILGKKMMKGWPKKINRTMGYRTPLSMINEDTWKFANTHCGKIYWKLGLFTIIPSFLIHIPFYGSSINVIGFLSITLVILQLIALVCPFFSTESALDKTFNSDGTRK